MIDADEVIANVMSLARHYETTDPQRYPFLLGAMQGKVRELIYKLNNIEEELENLKDLMRED